MSTYEINGCTITEEPKSPGYHFATRAASELSEIEKHELISYLMLTIAEADEEGDGETLFELMMETAALIPMKVAAVGVEDIAEQAEVMGDPLTEYEVAEVAASEGWQNLEKALNAVALEAVRAVIVSAYPPESAGA